MWSSGLEMMGGITGTLLAEPRATRRPDALASEETAATSVPASTAPAPLQSLPYDVMVELGKWLNRSQKRALYNTSSTLRGSLPEDFGHLAINVSYRSRSRMSELSDDALRPRVRHLRLSEGAPLSEVPVMENLSMVIIDATFGPFFWSGPTSMLGEAIMFGNPVTAEIGPTPEIDYTASFDELGRFFRTCPAERLFICRESSAPARPLYMKSYPNALLHTASAMPKLTRISLEMTLPEFCDGPRHRQEPLYVPDGVATIDCLQRVYNIEEGLFELYETSLGRFMSYRHGQRGRGVGVDSRNPTDTPPPPPVVNIHNIHPIYIETRANRSAVGPPLGYTRVDETTVATSAQKIPNLWHIRMLKHGLTPSLDAPDPSRSGLLIAPALREGEDGRQWFQRSKSSFPNRKMKLQQLQEALHPESTGDASM